jgi:hypothetical protein
MSSRPRAAAALFLVLTLGGCASVAAGPEQAPSAPYQQAILATPAECTSGIAGQRAPAPSLGRASDWC